MDKTKINVLSDHSKEAAFQLWFAELLLNTQQTVDENMLYEDSFEEILKKESESSASKYDNFIVGRSRSGRGYPPIDTDNIMD